MAEAAAPKRFTRRTFLGWWLASVMAAIPIIGGAPLLLFLWPASPKGQKKGLLTITLDKPIDQLQDGEAVKFNAPSSPNSAFIMADGVCDNAAGDLSFPQGGGLVVLPACTDLRHRFLLLLRRHSFRPRLPQAGDRSLPLLLLHTRRRRSR